MPHILTISISVSYIAFRRGGGNRQGFHDVVFVRSDLHWGLDRLDPYNTYLRLLLFDSGRKGRFTEY